MSLTPLEMVAYILSHVLSDEDIISGREQLHPEWQQIFRSNKSSLQKHLPPEEFIRISQIFESTYDAGVEKVDPDSSRLTFLLGAGASKPKPSDIPTVKELLPDLLTRARRLDREDVTRLAEFCDKARISNIEDLLTAAHLSEFCSRNPTVLRLVDFLLYRGDESTEPPHRRRRSFVDVYSVAFLQDTLQVLFGLLSSRMLPAKPNKGHEAIANYVRDHANAEIITTNYDCCIDLALKQEGKDFSYLIEFANYKPSSDGGSNLARLIKLHGSLNWFYCETCQQVQLVDIERTVNDYLDDKASYPVIGVCKDCGGQRRGLLVPPLAMKFDVAPPLHPLLDNAVDALSHADVIVIVGFSFADADLYISRMLSKSMQISNARNLIIFDPDYSVVEKVRRKFSSRIPGFDPSRILWVGGDCSETLPKFLSRKLVTPEPTPEITGAVGVEERVAIAGSE